MEQTLNDPLPRDPRLAMGPPCPDIKDPSDPRLSLGEHLRSPKWIEANSAMEDQRFYAVRKVQGQPKTIAGVHMCVTHIHATCHVPRQTYTLHETMASMWLPCSLLCDRFFHAQSYPIGLRREDSL